ncbi:kinase-like domain-containing protein, partial [Catenaria anguillulae PL171]
MGWCKSDKCVCAGNTVEPTVEFLKKTRVNALDFDVIERLGQGYFGEVSLVRDKHDGGLYAMKKLFKGRISNLDYFMEERDILAQLDSPFLTSLHAAFQDQNHLYLAMEYLPGGDLMGLLDNKENGKFYASQMVAAVEALHSAGYMHRDIKPNNILITRDGHIKLADFGSCARVGPDGMVRCQISVGTPDYISPEVLESQNSKNAAYGLQSDWWGVGVVLYEMLFGTTPFTDDSISVTYANIMSADGNIDFPDDVEVSDEFKNLINSLLSKPAKRLGKNGASEVKAHAFFKGIDWSNLHAMTPPFVPELESDTDTKYFQLDD